MIINYKNKKGIDVYKPFKLDNLLQRSFTISFIDNNNLTQEIVTIPEENKTGFILFCEEINNPYFYDNDYLSANNFQNLQHLLKEQFNMQEMLMIEEVDIELNVTLK